MFDRARIQDFAPGEGVAAGAYRGDFDDAAWIPSTIPGGVHTALIAAGRIEDPFYGENEKACAWIEEREWWFRFTFDGPTESVEPDERDLLTFLGLDTYATVWLDGAELGSHENMFRPAVFDVTERLRPGGAHLVAIKFDPPLARIEGKTISTWGRNPERSAMRKAQFGYGWDWGPRLPTIGLWRPIELERQRQAVISGIHFSTIQLAPRQERAIVAVRVEAERFTGSQLLSARITLISQAGDVATSGELTLSAAGDILDGVVYLTVEQPQLWWTHDLGEPARYTLIVTLEANGEALDQETRAVGIRTLELDQSPDLEERGTRHFRFVLNGVPIFVRGANWIPCESFIESIPAARYELLITAARDGNMNILRVWGGGLWEHDPFYDTCDRLGLLVWQDFMFACAMYPEDDPTFIAEVEAEARYQVRRLRAHPSLALWCGNNENQWINDMYFWNNPAPPPYGELYYHKMLPAVVAELDGATPYWPGSPFGGDDHNDRRQGNVHNWDVWHGNVPRRFGEEVRVDRSPSGVSFLRYAQDMGRFISEFGMHAAPVRETLARVIPAEQLYHHSPAMDWHNKDNPKDKGDNLMIGVTGLPSTLDEYIDFSMIAQAEGLKFGIEHFRRRKPHCSGTIVWQLNDCWPVLSWSVLDYYGVGKAGYFYLKRVYAPVLASFKQLDDGAVELWITNDALQPIDETILVRLGSFEGETIWNERIAVDVPANTSRAVASWSAGRLAAAPDRYLVVRSDTGTFPVNRDFFAAIKDLAREPGDLNVTISPKTDHALQVSITAPADHYAYFVHVTAPHEATRFEDNYFDLEPGECRTIAVTNASAPISASDLTVRAR